jgi:quinol monooxygenase YgiN
MPLKLNSLPFFCLSVRDSHEMRLTHSKYIKTNIMEQLALLARLEAKPGKERELEEFIKGALPLAQDEAGTIRWYALKLGPSTFGIFDTFGSEEGRQAHLSGPIAKALIEKAPDLLSVAPAIEQVGLLAVK